PNVAEPTSHNHYLDAVGQDSAGPSIPGGPHCGVGNVAEGTVALERPLCAVVNADGDDGVGDERAVAAVRGEQFQTTQEPAPPSIHWRRRNTSNWLLSVAGKSAPSGAMVSSCARTFKRPSIVPLAGSILITLKSVSQDAPIGSMLT